MYSYSETEQTTTFNWEKYDHGQGVLSGSTFTFNGYTANGYNDFWFCNNTKKTKKRFTFTLDESSVNYHSFTGGGFLFGMKDYGDGTFEGYAMLIDTSNIKIVYINKVNKSTYSNTNNFSYQVLASNSKVNKSSHEIVLDVDGTKVKVSDAGQEKINFTLPTYYGEAFGIVADHKSHNCSKKSKFVLKNLVLNDEVEDATPPTATHTISPNGWTNGNVTITINAKDNMSGVRSITLPNGTVSNNPVANGKNYSVSYVATNNGRYNFVIKDVANFTTNYSVTISNIDRDGPVITPTISTTSWTKGNVNINLKLSDSKSGFNYVVLPNGNISYSTEVNYLLTENKKVTFVAYDKVGNTTTYTVNVTNIDKTAPTYTKAEILNKNKYGYDVYIYGVADNNGGSGINRVQFPTWTSKNGQDDLDSNWANSTTSRGTNLGNGIWKFHVNTADHNIEYGEYITHIYIYDNVGNYSMTSVSIVIDNTPPVLDLSIDYDLYTTDPVTITAIATDDCTGVHRIVKPDGSVVYGDNTTYVVKKNGLYTFKCYDEANNETIKTIEIKNIIDVEPCSGLKSVEYRLSGDTVTSDWVDYTGTFGILNEGITYIEARAFDNAGNVSYDNSVAKIDRTKPINGTIEINTTIK